MVVLRIMKNPLILPEITDRLASMIEKEADQDSAKWKTCISVLRNAQEGMHAALAAVVLLETFYRDQEPGNLAPVFCSMGLHDTKEPISFQDFPLACLLVVCDELQERGRTFVDTRQIPKVVQLPFIDVDLSENSIEIEFDYSNAKTF